MTTLGAPPPPESSFNDLLVDSILDVPYPVLEYDRWLRDQASPRTAARDYLFAEDKPRFEPRKDDIVVVHPGVQVRERGGVVRLALAASPADIELPGVPRKTAERILAAIDGTRRLMQVRWHAETEPAVFARFLRATFGLLVFAPDAVSTLEHALSAAEIVRFPSSPYAVQRPYWENMVAVREQFLAAWPGVSDAGQWLRLLRKLHVTAVLGRHLDNFYKPASPGADARVNPGALLHDEPRLLATPAGRLFLDGPRVNVSWIGGERWHRLVRLVGGEDGVPEAEPRFHDGDLPWGSIVIARADNDEQVRPWFCPPRPWQQGHTDYLFRQLVDADRASAAGRRAETVEALARFHQAFVRLHPFHCANQCLAMNVVNALLMRVAGAGMPHLVLDHLALRLSTAAYERVFALAADGFVVTGAGPAQRLSTLRDRRARSFALIDKLGACKSDEEEASLLQADPRAAAWALVSPIQSSAQSP